MASIAKVALTPREVYETDDRDFLAFAWAVIERTMDVRAEAARKAQDG